MLPCIFQAGGDNRRHVVPCRSLRKGIISSLTSFYVTSQVSFYYSLAFRTKPTSNYVQKKRDRRQNLSVTGYCHVNFVGEAWQKYLTWIKTIFSCDKRGVGSKRKTIRRNASFFPQGNNDHLQLGSSRRWNLAYARISLKLSYLPVSDHAMHNLARALCSALLQGIFKVKISFNDHCKHVFSIDSFVEQEAIEFQEQEHYCVSPKKKKALYRISQSLGQTKTFCLFGAVGILFPTIFKRDIPLQFPERRI